jgi:hypothetical protein
VPHSIPRSSIAAPPSAVTSPRSVAEFCPMSIAASVDTSGTDGAAGVVNGPPSTENPSWPLFAQARK